MRYVSNDEIGNEPTEQLQVMNQLISVLRGDKKLKPFCLNVIKNTLDLYEWSLKEFRNPQSKRRALDQEIRKQAEDYIYLHIDYSSTMDDLEIPMWKIEETMAKAFFFAR